MMHPGARDGNVNGAVGAQTRDRTVDLHVWAEQSCGPCRTSGTVCESHSHKGPFHPRKRGRWLRKPEVGPGGRSRRNAGGTQAGRALSFSRT